MIIYQILMRLWGNLNDNLVWNGTKAENGCGTMNAVSRKALDGLRRMGVSHVWYTGLLAHSTTTDYAAWGLPHNHAAMVKGRAGSPYAVRDYYDIDADLASSPERRWKEFRALVERTHRAGLKMIMDFVPNHVAREYRSTMKPVWVRDLGEDDDRTCAFSPNNNFYYIPGQRLSCSFDMKGNEPQPYVEEPARATGNDCFGASPSKNDWYETIKLNYGVDYCGGRREYFDPIPDTWTKMKDILLYWCGHGVDGFRCDMAEMVPCSFWNWAIHKVKEAYPEVIFIGEVYNPSLYRDYINRGGFDLLYDKVGLYDTIRSVIEGKQWASAITGAWQAVGDIAPHMLNFLENHDEQRVASDFFAGNAEKGKAGVAVAACMRGQAFMLYFGQELGECGMDEEGFSGRDGRTTIFDYWSMKSLRQWQEIDYCTRKLPAEVQPLRQWYKKVLTLSQKEKALRDGMFFDLMYVNYNNSAFDCRRVYAFLRKADNELVIVVANFGDCPQTVSPYVPAHAFETLEIEEGEAEGKDLLNGRRWKGCLRKDGQVTVDVPAYGAAIIKVVLAGGKDEA